MKAESSRNLLQVPILFTEEEKKIAKQSFYRFIDSVKEDLGAQEEWGKWLSTLNLINYLEKYCFKFNSFWFKIQDISMSVNQTPNEKQSNRWGVHFLYFSKKFFRSEKVILKL